MKLITRRNPMHKSSFIRISCSPHEREGWAGWVPSHGLVSLHPSHWCCTSHVYNSARGCNFRSRSQRYTRPPMLGRGNLMVSCGILPTINCMPLVSGVDPSYTMGGTVLPFNKSAQARNCTRLNGAFLKGSADPSYAD